MIMTYHFNIENYFRFSNLCQAKKCDYLFVVDSVTHLDNPDTLTQLLLLNKYVNLELYRDILHQSYFSISAEQLLAQ